MNPEMQFPPNIYLQKQQLRNSDERIFGRPFGGFGFHRPFGGFGFGYPFLGGLAGGLLGSALLSPYGFGGYGFPYGYGYGYGYGFPYGYY